MFANLLENIVAADFGHHDVQENDVVASLANQFKRFFATFGQLDFEAAALQPAGQHGAIELDVVDDEYSGWTFWLVSLCASRRSHVLPAFYFGRGNVGRFLPGSLEFPGLGVARAVSVEHESIDRGEQVPSG